MIHLFKVCQGKGIGFFSINSYYSLPNMQDKILDFQAVKFASNFTYPHFFVKRTCCPKKASMIRMGI